MRITYRDEHLAIIDDCFSEAEFQGFWKFFTQLDFENANSEKWHKVWRINDGQILKSKTSYSSNAPFSNQLDILDKMVSKLSTEVFSDLVGVKGTDYNEISYSPYLYPVGSKISWHDDFNYSGACIFYTHQQWEPYWGGELLVAKTPSKEECKNITNSNKKTDYLARDFVSPILNAYGMGIYVAPLPNRMVFTSGSAWHCINRVDQSAGDKVRCSVVSFFEKRQKPVIHYV